jgi:hypothetical protein
VWFEADTNEMYILADQDDTVVPARLKNWYMCKDKGLAQQALLHWKLGASGEPQDMSCVKVDIVRDWF